MAISKRPARTESLASIKHQGEASIVVSVQEILANNPHIDPESVAGALATIGDLRRLGIRNKKYNLRSPYSRRVLREPETTDAPIRAKARRG